jgi:Methyltransferase domain
MKKIIDKLVRYTVPYGVMIKYKELQRKKKRDEFISLIKTSCDDKKRETITWEEIIDFLSERNSRGQIIAGSMPKIAIETISKVLEERFSNPEKSNTGQGITGVHIGNFVGVSLALLTNVIKNINEGSIMISIDPNIPHRGIENPQQHVLSLLNKYELTRNSMVLTSYSLRKNLSNDGKNYGTEYIPEENYNSEASCEGGLEFLARIHTKVDFIVIDGNHDETYLKEEIKLCNKLLKKGGLLILDDVSPQWHGVEEVFELLKSEGYKVVIEDNRVGILEKIS